MRSWGEEVRRTWLADPDRVWRADDFVRGELARHRGLNPHERENVAAWSVERIVADVDAFAATNRWIWVTTGACLIAELLFAAKGGTIFRIDDGPPSPALRALHILRNAMFHPAHARAGGSGEPHVAQLVEHLRGNGEADLAEQLARNWAFLAERPIAAFAVRMLDGAAREHPNTREFIPPRAKALARR
jgi:hypothetical protein